MTTQTGEYESMADVPPQFKAVYEGEWIDIMSATWVGAGRSLRLVLRYPDGTIHRGFTQTELTRALLDKSRVERPAHLRGWQFRAQLQSVSGASWIGWEVRGPLAAAQARASS